ncbi:MAG: hypothetical protein LJE68_15195 [Rhodobacter sp.]|nr:hypothetical protein [Rhodobacter sp.]
MSRSVIFEIPGFVSVIEEPALKAVRIRYDRLFDEAGRNIPAAVRAAAAFASENSIPNWIADTSIVRDELSERDAAWVRTQEFRGILLQSPVKTFVLIPAPEDADGIDNGWIPKWRDETEAGFEGQIAVHVLNEKAMRELLGASLA